MIPRRDWEDHNPNLSPYVEWFEYEQPDKYVSPHFLFSFSGLWSQRFVSSFWSGGNQADASSEDILAPDAPSDAALRSKNGATSGEKKYSGEQLRAGMTAGEKIPIQDLAFHPKGEKKMKSPPAEALKLDGSKLNKDSVITGVIDVGIGPGHDRFRRGATGSRILAHWQQGAPHAGQPQSPDACEHDAIPQDGLPFGREYYQHDIEAAMARHTHDGWLDEVAFNRALRISEPTVKFGSKELELGAAHGTHVADLAAGMDPFGSDEALDTRPMITVNMPDRKSHGSAGNYLEVLAGYAIERIVQLADAIWAKEINGGKSLKDPTEGFRLVINLSFGKQAGPKTGNSFFEKVCRDYVERSAGRIAIVLPAGNDNLDRAHAHFDLPKMRDGEAQTDRVVPWRVVPQDQTSNFVELWTLPVAIDRAKKDAAQAFPDTGFRIAVLAPGEELGEGHWTEPQLNKKLRLARGVRVYCEALEWPEKGKKWLRQVRFVFCLAPSLSWDRAPSAPAGLWHIAVRYEGRRTEFHLNVQSDQAVIASSAIAARSYFDDHNYHRYTEHNDAKRKGMLNPEAKIPQGALADSFHFPDQTHLEYWPRRGPVQRKGTLNAIATARGLCVIGGYRLSDGAPARYSATTRGKPIVTNATSGGHGDGRTYISVLAPSDRGYATPGVVAAGARSGSIVVWQGTSMSSGLAARYLVEHCIANPSVKPTEEALKETVSDALTQLDGNLKYGSGRIASSWLHIFTEESAKWNRHNWGGFGRLVK